MAGLSVACADVISVCMEKTSATTFVMMMPRS
jgi:hypothetical protein